MEWTAEALLARLENEPGLRVEDLIRERALSMSRSYRAALIDFQTIASDDRYRKRFLAHAQVEDEDLTYGFSEPDPTDRKATWIWHFLRTRNQNQACAIAGVNAKEVTRWFTSGERGYDPGFADLYQEAHARVVMAYEDEVQTARKMAKATGDAKTLAYLSTRALESLHSKRWGRNRLEISGSVDHRHTLPGATAAQLAARSERLLGPGDDVIEGEEVEELPS